MTSTQVGCGHQGTLYRMATPDAVETVLRFNGTSDGTGPARARAKSTTERFSERLGGAEREAADWIRTHQHMPAAPVNARGLRLSSQRAFNADLTTMGV